MRRTSGRALAAAGVALGLAACGLTGGASLPGAPSVDGSARAEATSLPSGVWRLFSLRETGQAEVPMPADRFTAEFAAGGQVSLRVDCNRCRGSYTAGARTLGVGAMACTRAYCTATAPLDSTYESLFSRAETWTSDGDQHLEVASAAGVLRFQR